MTAERPFHITYIITDALRHITFIRRKYSVPKKINSAPFHNETEFFVINVSLTIVLFCERWSIMAYETLLSNLQPQHQQDTKRLRV